MVKSGKNSHIFPFFFGNVPFPLAKTKKRRLEVETIWRPTSACWSSWESAGDFLDRIRWTGNMPVTGRLMMIIEFQYAGSSCEGRRIYQRDQVPQSCWPHRKKNLLAATELVFPGDRALWGFWTPQRKGSWAETQIQMGDLGARTWSQSLTLEHQARGRGEFTQPYTVCTMLTGWENNQKKTHSNPQFQLNRFLCQQTLIETCQ